MGVPDDWAYLPMWGALSDLLSSGAEKTDNSRAQYALQRFNQGVEVFKNANWLLQANINGVPVDTPSLHEQDLYSVGWQNNAGAWNALVQLGTDVVGVCPVAACGVGVTLVGSAPVLDSTGVYIQVSRDDWSSILDYAVHLSCFKQAGTEFAATIPLMQDFFRAAASTNERLMNMGLFTAMLHSEGKRETEEVPR
jgi:hypothetical protein